AIKTEFDTSPTSLGGQAKTYAGQFGVDYQLNDHWLAGISFTYADGQVDYNQGRGKTEMQTYRFGPYVAFTQDNWFANGAMTYAFQPNDMTRIAHSGPGA